MNLVAKLASPPRPPLSAARHATTELALDKEFHDSHGRTVDRVLLSPTAGAVLIKELRSLGHSHTNQLRL